MAAFFWIAGVNSNWNQIGNWSATSGGASNGATPTTTSDVTFDGAGANGNNASTVNANINTLSITFTSGYTNTVTQNTGTTLQTNGGNFTDNTAHSWVINGTGQLVLIGACTINSGGKTFPGAVQFASASTKTLSANWTITGTLTISANTVINSNILTIGGGLSAASGSISGTTKFVFNGTGTIVATIPNDVDINTAGTITVSTLNYKTGTLRLVAVGTLLGSGLAITGSCTLDIAGATWPLVTFNTSGVTVTLNSLLTATTLSFTASGSSTLTFAGSFGWTCATFSSTNNGVATITLVNGNTYTITDSFTCVSATVVSGANKPIFISNDGTLRANLILLNASSTCNVVANFTRINAAGGRPINAFNGIITDSINVASYSNVLFNPITTLKRGFRRFGLWDVNRRVTYK